MPLITLQDLQILTTEMDRYTSMDLLPEDGARGIRFSDSLDEIIKDNNGDFYQVIFDLLGSYLHAMPIDIAKGDMTHFIFFEDISTMPLFINKSEDTPGWKTIVARWRLKISSH